MLRLFWAWRGWRDDRPCLCGCARLAHRHNRPGSQVRTVVSYCGRHILCARFRPRGLPWRRIIARDGAPLRVR